MCIIALKSNTFAQKAKRILQSNGIKAEIMRLEPNLTKNGCSYGVSLPCDSLYLSETLLNQNRLKYTEIIK